MESLEAWNQKCRGWCTSGRGATEIFQAAAHEVPRSSSSGSVATETPQGCRGASAAVCQPRQRGDRNTNRLPRLICRGCPTAKMATAAERPFVFQEGILVISGPPINIPSRSFQRHHLPARIITAKIPSWLSPSQITNPFLTTHQNSTFP